MSCPSFRILPLFVGMLMLSACATATDYPSLERRDVERVSGSAEPAPTDLAPAPTPPPPSADVTARLSQLVAQAGTAHDRFETRRARAHQAVGAAVGAAPGTEGWSTASVAVSELESARSDAMIAMAELDTLLASEGVTHYDTPSGDGRAIAAAHAQVQGWIADEDAVLDSLKARLGS